MDSRKEINNILNEAIDSIEQMKLCLFNGQRIEKINRKQFFQHLRNVKTVLNKDNLNSLIKNSQNE